MPETSPAADGPAAIHDEFETYDRIYLEKLHLATNAILQVGEDEGMLTDIFQTELFLFRDRVERAMLLKPSSLGELPE